MTAAPRDRRGGSEIHRDPSGAAGRETQSYRQREMGKLKSRAGGRTTGTGRLSDTSRVRDSGSEIQEEGETAEKLHNKEEPEPGADGLTAGQATDLSAFSRLAQSPISWANHPLRQQQQSSLILLALATLPFALPPPITPAIISLVQNELLQLQPRQLFHLGASAGAGWLGPRGMPSWTAGGNGNGGGQEGGQAPIKAHPRHPQGSRHTGPLMLVWLILSCSLNPAQHPAPSLGSILPQKSSQV